MTEENGNGKKWLRKPQFSIEDIVKLAVFLGPWIIGASVGILALKDVPKNASQAKATADSTLVLAKQLSMTADTVRAQMATKEQVQSGITQGNQIHKDQYRRIVALERRQGLVPGPVPRSIRVFEPLRRDRDVTYDLWREEADNGEYE